MTTTTFLITLSTIISMNNISENRINSNINYPNANSISTFDSSTSAAIEPNDNINEAISLVEEGFHLEDIYTNSFDATIDCHLGASDSDFYYVPILTDTEMTINVRESENYPFEMYVYTYIYNEDGISENKACKSLHTLREEDNENQKYKSFSIDASPGTYVILIKSDSAREQRVIVNYHISLRLEKKDQNTAPQSMGELKYCKGAFGAVWKSDYLPVLNDALLKPYQCLTYYKEGTYGIENRDYALEELMRISNGENIHLATYYLWDGEMICLLNSVYSSIYKCLEENFSNSDKLRVEFELVRDEIGRVTSIGGKLFNILGDYASFSTLSILSANTFLNIFNYSLVSYLESLIPTYSYVDYQYFNWLKSYLYTIPNLSENDQIKYWKNFVNNSALIIPIYYRLTVQKGVFSINDEYQIDFSATLEENQSLTNLYHLDDDLPVVVSDDFYFRGKLYGMKYGSDNEILIEDARFIPYESIQPDVLEVGITDSVPNLNRKEMKWYKFVAETEGDYSLAIYRKYSNNSYEDYATDCSLSVYNQIYYGYDESHAIYSTNVGYYEGDVVLGPYYEAHLQEGQTLYFRINGVNFNSIDLCTITIRNYFANNMNIEQSNHVHTYINEYIWNSLTRHISVCACGAQQFEHHVITGSSSSIGRYATCALCHGSASVGIVNEYSLRNNVEYELREDGLYYPLHTYIANGNIVLDYDDSIAFINNNRNLYDIIGN